MPEQATRSPTISKTAFGIFACLRRRGGSQRIAPLLQETRLAVDDLATAVNELVEHGWVKVEWRTPRNPLPEAIPERIREVERITTTRFGRYRHAVTWPAD
jgi:hypothetical protein